MGTWSYLLSYNSFPQGGVVGQVKPILVAALALLGIEAQNNEENWVLGRFFGWRAGWHVVWQHMPPNMPPNMPPHMALRLRPVGKPPG